MKIGFSIMVAIIVLSIFGSFVQGAEYIENDDSKFTGKPDYLLKIHPELLEKPEVGLHAIAPERKVKALVTVSNDYEMAKVKTVISQNGGIVRKTFDIGNVIVADKIPQSKLVNIAKEKSVISIWPNFRVFATLDKSVPQVRAPEVWNKGYNGENVRIAVLDTGIDILHPMLKRKVVKEKDFSASSTTADIYGHGTHVAGIIAGSRQQGKHDGVAPGALLFNAKVLDDNGSGDYEDIIAGINWAVNPDGNPDTSDGAQIINMSLGSAKPYDPADALVIAVKDAVGKGVIVVASVGNCGPMSPSENCEGYIGATIPGSSPDVLSVGAVDDQNKWAEFSSGQNIENVGIKPDITAPGVLVDSSYPNNRYRQVSGTSMAAPHVSGAAAIIINAEPSISPVQLKRLLELTAKDFGEPGKDTKFGWGLLDLNGITEPRVLVSKENISASIDESQQYNGTVTITNIGIKKLEIYSYEGTEGIRTQINKNYLEAADSARLDFSVNPSGSGQFEGSIDIKTNAGDKKINIKLEIAPSTKPIIKSVNIPEIVWRGEIKDIVIEAADDSAVSSVKLTLVKPDRTTAQIGLVLSADGKWRYLDYKFPEEVSDTGIYRFVVTAADDSANSTLFEGSFNLVNAQYKIFLETIVNTPVEIKAFYKNTALQSKEATVVAGIYNDVGEKIDELTQTAELGSGELHEFTLNWIPGAIGNYSIEIKLYEEGREIDQTSMDFKVLVPDAIKVQSIVPGSLQVQKGTAQSFELKAENVSDRAVDALLEIDIMRGEVVADVISVENISIDAASSKIFPLQKDIMLPAGEYSARAKIHYGNRITESNPVAFNVVTPATGKIEPIELAEKIYTDRISEINTVFTNTGQVPLNVSIYGIITKGNVQVRKIDIASAKVMPSERQIFSANNDFSGMSGQYIIKIIVEYEGNIEQAEKEFFVIDDKAPAISNVSFDSRLKKNGIFSLNFDATDSSKIAKALMNIAGKEIEMEQTEENKGIGSFSGYFYDTKVPGEYRFSARVCDEYSNCSALAEATFAVENCTTDSLLVVSDENYFSEILKDKYCITDFRPSEHKGISKEYMTEFDATIWSEGVNADPVDENEMKLLENYISEGGKLVLEGAGIVAKHRDDNFMKNVAHAVGISPQFNADETFGSGQTNPKRIYIKRMHPITKLSNPVYLDLENFDYNPVTLVPTNKGESVAYWENKNPAIIIFEGTLPENKYPRTIFLPFNLNAVKEPKQKELIENIAEWLMKYSSTDFSVNRIDVPEHIVSGEQTPITIAVSSTELSEVRVYIDGEFAGRSVEDSQTRQITLNIPAGRHTIKAEINPSYEEPESNYLNNLLEKEVFAAGPQVDFAVTDIRTETLPDGQTRIYSDILNKGGKNGIATIYTRLDNEQIGGEIQNINRGEKITITTDWPETIGVHKIKVLAQVWSTETDANIENNSMESEVYICDRSISNILIVADDDAKQNLLAQSPVVFEEILKRYSFCFSTWKESENGIPEIGLLKKFDAVIWSSGNHWNTAMDDKDIALLKNFNGNILYEGADIAFDSNDSKFLEKNLHAIFDRDIVLDENNSKLILGKSVLLKSIDLIDLNAQFSPMPDSIIPADTERVADWNGAEAAIISSDKINRQVYMTFSIAAIKDNYTRQLLIMNILGWLTEQDFTACTIPEDGMAISTNTTLCAGSYELPGGISIVSGKDINLMCSGTILEGKGSSKPGIYVKDSNNTSVENCTVTGFAQGIYAVDSNFVSIKNNNLYANSSGIAVKNSSKFAIFGNKSVSNADGINLDNTIDGEIKDNNASSNNNGIKISNAILEKISPYGIYDFNNIVVEKNIASGNTGFGIEVFDSNHIRIIQNKINANGSGVKLFSAIFSEVRANEIIRNTSSGILIEHSKNSYTRENEVIENRNGITILKSNKNTVDDDNVSLNSDNGILIEESSDNSVSYNYISGNTTGVRVLDSNGNVFGINRVLNNEIGFTIVDSVGNTLNKNIVSENDEIGLAFDGNPYRNHIIDNNFHYTGIKPAPYNVFCFDGIGNSYFDGATGPTCDNENGPKVELIETVNAYVGEEFELRLDASDGDELTFMDFSELFDIDGKAGVIKFMPKKEDIGLHGVTILVFDDSSAVSMTFNIKVIDGPNLPPVLTIPHYSDVYTEREEVVIRVEGSDPNNDPISYAINSENFIFTDNSFRWKTTENSAGNYTFTITASDGKNSVSKFVIVSVLKILPGNLCTDSDGGLNYTQASIADDRDDRGIGSWWEDVCLLRVPCEPGDPGFDHPVSCMKYTRVDECTGPLCNLQEGYCTEGKSSNIAVTCEFGCRKGACITRDLQIQSNENSLANSKRPATLRTIQASATPAPSRAPLPSPSPASPSPEPAEIPTPAISPSPQPLAVSSPDPQPFYSPEPSAEPSESPFPQIDE